MQRSSLPPSSSSTNGDKQDVTMDQLPKAVKTTVQRESKGKNVESMKKSTKNGAVAYEVKILDGSKETTLDIANDGKVYIASEDGQVFVIAAGRKYEVIAMNEMSTPVLATPAISDGRLFLRTGDQVMAIGMK